MRQRAVAALLVGPLLGLSLALAAAPPAAPQAPVFGASADLVLIDLVATDRDGRPVTDLRAEEIRVREQGQSRPVEFLHFVSVGAGPPESTPPAPLAAALPAGAEAMIVAARAAPPTLVVVVDLLTMPADAVIRARDAIAALSEDGLAPGTRLMLVVIGGGGLRVAQPMTDDAAAFQAAARALKPGFERSDASLFDLIERVRQSCDGTPGGSENAVTLAMNYTIAVRLALDHTMRGLAALTRSLTPLPGRKHVVLLSAGHPVQPAAAAADVVGALCGGGSGAYATLRSRAQVDAPGLLRLLVDDANRAQASIYTVDVLGLGSDMPGADKAVTARFVTGGGMTAVRAALRAPQEILHSIADGTGGTATLNSNDIGRGVREASRDARGYYLLAYVPPADRKAGRFYEIELEVARPGLNVRYRRGYEWLSDEERLERETSAVVMFPGLYAQGAPELEARVEAGLLRVVARLPTRGLRFRKEGELQVARVELQGLLRDAAGKVVGKHYFFARTVDLRLSAERFAELTAQPDFEISIEAAAPTKQGRYALTLVANHGDGRLAAGMTAFEVP